MDRFEDMELLNGKSLSRYLLDKYSKRPKGWNFVIAPSAKDNFFDAIVTGPEESWQIKIDSIFKPSPLMLGTKVEVESRPIPPNTLPYGYRKLDPETVLKLLNDMTDENHASSNFESFLESIDPVAPSEQGSYAQGPFVFTNKKISGVSKSQRELDERLSVEIKKLLRDKYPLYG